MSPLQLAGLGLVIAVLVALLVTYTIALAAGDAEAIVDATANLIPGWKHR